VCGNPSFCASCLCEPFNLLNNVRKVEVSVLSRTSRFYSEFQERPRGMKHSFLHESNAEQAALWNRTLWTVATVPGQYRNKKYSRITNTMLMIIFMSMGWHHVSELRPPADIRAWCNDIDRGTSDSSTRALWKSYQQSSSSKSAGTWWSKWRI
jgi:hypothetical protein